MHQKINIVNNIAIFKIFWQKFEIGQTLVIFFVKCLATRITTLRYGCWSLTRACATSTPIYSLYELDIHLKPR